MAEPGGSGPIGPYPPTVTGEAAQTEYDKLRRRLLWAVPSGLYVLGSRAGERRNAMTCNWFTQVSFEPKLVGIGVDKAAFTHELISEGKVFAVNVIDREDRAIVRKFTKPVYVDAAAMTLNGFAYRESITGAPILVQAAGYLDCEVRQAVDSGSHTFFIGEIVDCGFQKPEDTDVLRMEDTRMSYGG
jgi:flavin reductase (DIM6/NTAB) family NADH-FMN oxidoreductase RutF